MRIIPLSPYHLLTAFIVFLLLDAGIRNGWAEDKSLRSQQEQIEAIESKLSQEREKLEAFDYQEKDLLTLLAELEREVSEKRKAVEQLGSKVRHASKEISRMNKRLEKLEKEASTLEAKMAERLVIMYKYARKGTFRVLANAEDVNQFWRRARYLRAILEEDRRMMLELAEQQNSVRAEISGLQRQLLERKASKDEEEKHLAALKQELDQKVIRLMKVHREKEFYATAVRELESAAKELKQAFQTIEKRPVYKAAPEGRLEDSKGRLPFPMEGRVMASSKLSASTGLQGSKGILITGSSDSEVKAVFPGRVDFSGKLKGYGNVVIISHGSRYFSISGHLSERTKKEGEMVKGGETIGWVRGNKSSEPWLYFEMRKGEAHLDALKWLKPSGQAQR